MLPVRYSGCFPIKIVTLLTTHSRLTTVRRPEVSMLSIRDSTADRLPSVVCELVPVSIDRRIIAEELNNSLTTDSMTCITLAGAFSETAMIKRLLPWCVNLRVLFKICL